MNTLSQMRSDLTALFKHVDSKIEEVTGASHEVMQELAKLRQDNEDLYAKCHQWKTYAEHVEERLVSEAQRSAYWYGQFMVVDQILKSVHRTIIHARDQAHTEQVPFSPLPEILNAQQVDGDSLLPSEQDNEPEMHGPESPFTQVEQEMQEIVKEIEDHRNDSSKAMEALDRTRSY